METSVHANHPSLSLWDSLFSVSPLSCELDGGLDSLHTRVHGQNHVVSKQLGDLFSVGSEVGRVECSGREGDKMSLGCQGLEDSRVAVALVDSRIS